VYTSFLMAHLVNLIVADDSPVILKAVSGVVADCCSNVRITGEAKDFGELFRLLEEVPADIVLMDVNMPSEKPVEAEVLCSYIGSRCLLVMSAWFDETTKAMAAEFCAKELLDKGRLVDTLQGAIERCAEPNEKSAGRSM
jgi:DNA-binding NarL/FixJ family response regulator